MENEKIMFILNQGKENLELALNMFKVIGGAIAMDIKPVVLFQTNGVNYAVKNALNDNDPKEKELKSLINMYIENGNKLYICESCIKERKITEDMLIEGSTLARAAQFLNETLSSKNVIVY